MTKSLIRLDNTVRTSLNDDCMTNRHDERQWDDNDDAMTETDSDITRGITNGYKREKESYKREREVIGERVIRGRTNGYRRERKVIGEKEREKL